MKKILTELVDIEKRAQKVRQNAEKDAKKLLLARKEQAGLLMSKKQEIIANKRSEELKATEERIKAEADAIENQGRSKAADVSKISPKKEEEAIKNIIETVLKA